MNQKERDLEERLDEAAEILKLPSSWKARSLEPSHDGADQHQASIGRCEWVLKWLLEKLKAPSNTQARSSHKAWLLLRSLVLLLPESVTARLLGPSDFLGIVEQTLRENETIDQHLPHSAAQVESTLAQHESKSPSRKRKRDSESPSAVSAPEWWFSSPPILMLVNDTIQAVVTLIQAARQRSDMISSEHLSSLLRVDFHKAVRVMALWQKTLSHLWPWELEVYQVSLEYPIVILDTSIHAQSTQLQLAMMYSEHCLDSSLKLWTRNRLDPKLGNEGLVRTAVCQQVDQLSLKYIILPARSAFSKSSPHVAAELPNIPDYLLSLLKPLRSEGSSHAEYEQAIPHLWRLVIQATPRTNPRQRTHAEPWLRAVFAAVADNAGAPITGRQDANIRSESIKSLETLLDVCIQEEVQLGTRTLDELIRRHSGMPSVDNSPTSWILIASALKLDANVFLPSPRNKDDPGSLDKGVLEHLSLVPWDKTGDPFTEFSSIAPSAVVASPEAQNEFQKVYGLAPDHFCRAIPIALMEAYTNARRLPDFLSLWHAELTRSAAHIVTGIGHSTVWEDRLFSQALGGLLERSLTGQQILETLLQFGHHFTKVGEAQTILHHFTRSELDATGADASASLVVLDALLSSINSDDTIELAQDILLSLYQTLARIGSEPALNELHIMARIWRILARIRVLLYTFNARHSNVDLSLETVFGDGFRAALTAISKASLSNRPPLLDRRIEALNFVLSTWYPLHLKQRIGEEACQDFARVLQAIIPGNLAEQVTSQDDANAARSFDVMAATRLSQNVWFFEYVLSLIHQALEF